jgi:hypothetical protein
MKIQMVCLANSTVEKGRVLVGILIKDGIPLVDSLGPRWIRLAVGPKQPTIPAGMVIDIVPRDILEFEAVMLDDLRDCKGTVVFDPYSVRFLGVMDEVMIANYCAHKSTDRMNVPGNAADFEGFVFINARSCAIEVGDEHPGNKEVDLDLKFEFAGVAYKFRIDDPWFLDVVQIDPEILDRKQDHYIVLQSTRKRGQREAVCSVMAVMV